MSLFPLTATPNRMETVSDTVQGPEYIEASLAEMAGADWFSRAGNPSVVAYGSWVHSWEETLRELESADCRQFKIRMLNYMWDQLMLVCPEKAAEWGEIRLLVGGRVKLIGDEASSASGRQGRERELVSQAVSWAAEGLALEAGFVESLSSRYFLGASTMYINGRFPCGWRGGFENGIPVVY